MAIEIKGIPVLKGEAARRFINLIESNRPDNDKPLFSKEDIEAVRKISQQAKNFVFKPKPNNN